MLERIDTSDSNAPSHQGKVETPRGLHGKMLKL